MKSVARWLAALAFTVAGIFHFVNPEPYLRIMPSWLPWQLGFVYVSGVCEIAGGIGLMIGRLQRLAAWGLVALLIAVFPANINMAVNEIPFGDQSVAVWLLWARLPFQAVFIVWVLWCTMPDGDSRE